MWFEAGTVRSLALRCPFSLPIHNPGPRPKYGARTPRRPVSLMEPFGCAPAAMPVGSSFSTCTAIGQCTAFWRLPWQASCPHPGHLGLQRLISPRRKTASSHTSSTLLVRGWFRHSPQIFTVSLHKLLRAQHILSTSVASTLFWYGRYSHSGLLHTTARSSPWRLFLNSSLRLPIAYHFSLETTPTDMITSS